jgi:hypothetical protein
MTQSCCPVMLTTMDAAMRDGAEMMLELVFVHRSARCNDESLTRCAAGVELENNGNGVFLCDFPGDEMRSGNAGSYAIPYKERHPQHIARIHQRCCTESERVRVRCPLFVFTRYFSATPLALLIVISVLFTSPLHNGDVAGVVQLQVSLCLRMCKSTEFVEDY